MWKEIKIPPVYPQDKTEPYPSANTFPPQDYWQLFQLFIEEQWQPWWSSQRFFIRMRKLLGGHSSNQAFLSGGTPCLQIRMSPFPLWGCEELWCQSSDVTRKRWNEEDTSRAQRKGYGETGIQAQLLTSHLLSDQTPQLSQPLFHPLKLEMIIPISWICLQECRTWHSRVLINGSPVLRATILEPRMPTSDHLRRSWKIKNVWTPCYFLLYVNGSWKQISQISHPFLCLISL